MTKLAFGSIVLSLTFATAGLAQQQAEPVFVRDAIGVKAMPAAPRMAERASLAAAVTLGAAELVMPEELEAIRTWNMEGREPAKNGFTRSLPDPVMVRLGGAVIGKGGSASLARGIVAASDRGTIIWSGSFKVQQADRMRLHLSNVKMPDGATMWVYGSAGQDPIAFGKELISPDGDLYTPSVGGDTVYLELEVPAQKDGVEAGFDVRDILQLVKVGALATFDPSTGTNDAPTCLIDAVCVAPSTLDVIDQYRRAVAHLEYVKLGDGYVCTGGLVNDSDDTTFVPYLLTANHCISSQTVASTLETFWDYKTQSCGGSFPNLNTFSHNDGSTLLATSTVSDFTFLRLNSVPGGRVFLGWKSAASATADGTKLYRISHPFPDTYTQPGPQSFSQTVTTSTFGNCQGRPLGNYVYSVAGQGGVYGGSSGSPVILAGGYIVGQLFGSCGPIPSNGCDNRNATLDGAFAVSFPSIQQYLTSGSPVTPTPCVPSATVACLSSSRFAVQVDWKTGGGDSGKGQAIKYTPDSGLFWFFGADNIEMIVKVLNACSLNNNYWIFAAATTDVEYTLKVTDTKTGQSKTYFHASGSPAPAVTDTSAFATCP
jgi:hypothetical protein